MCRIPLPIEAACATATGAECLATDVAAATCPGTDSGGRRLSKAVTKLTLVVCTDVSVANPAGAALLNDGAGLIAALEQAAGVGTVSADSTGAVHTTSITIVGNSTEDGAFALAAAAALGTAVRSSNTPLLNDPAAAAAGAAGGPPASPPPLCLTCLEAAASSDAMAGWTVAVIVICLSATLLFVGITAYLKVNRAVAAKEAGGGAAGVTLSATPAAVEAQPLKDSV